METRTLPAAFAHAAEWYPETEAFVQWEGGEGRRYTYAEADRAAGRLASALAEWGVGRGDRVAFLARPTVEHAIAFFAAQKLGAIPATLHVREAVGVLRGMAERVSPTVVIGAAEFAGALGELAGVDAVERALTFEEAVDGMDAAFDLADSYPERGSSAGVGADDPAFVNFSSGTTGRPKGIVHTHRESIEGAHLGAYKLRVREGRRYLVQATPSFIGWSMLVFPVVNTGATGVFLERWDPEAVLEIAARERLDLLLLVSTQWKRVIEADPERYDLSSVEGAVYTGEPIGVERLRRMREAVCDRVYTVYSSTEALNSGTVLFPERVTEATLDSVGRPVPNVDLRLVEPESADPERRVDPGEVGEVAMRGPSVAERVWDPGPETEDLFHEDGWWFSGDLGRIEDGDLYLEGRVDNLIITGGINVHAEGVERALEDHPGVREAAVVGVPDERWGERVTAHVVRADPDLTAEALEEWCLANEDLSDYQRPREYTFVGSLPRTTTGKLDRESLR